MTAVMDDSCSTAPERALLAPAGRPAAPAPAPALDGPGIHRAWVMVAFLLGTMARDTPGNPAGGHAQRPPAGAAVALTQGETRVLHYLPTNLSAREIARELFLSVNTIKTHQRHLYAKLGARNRSQAVERARALGLLAPARRRRLRGASFRPAGQDTFRSSVRVFTASVGGEKVREHHPEVPLRHRSPHQLARRALVERPGLTST